MKSRRLLIAIISFVLSIVLVGCSDRNVLPENAPSFLSPITAEEEMKSLFYGSNGWRLFHSYHSSYVYAEYGGVFVRYNIRENTVDKTVKLGKIAEGYSDRAISFSPDGRYVLLYDSWIGVSEFQPHNLYLLDFDNNMVKFLTETADDFNRTLLPKSSRDHFDEVKMRWDIDSKNLEKLDYNIVSEFAPEIGTVWYIVGKENQKSEITALRNSLNASDPPYVVIDDHTIGTLIPMEGHEGNDDRGYLGYYRFVLIDVITDTILQEDSLIHSDNQ